MNMKKLNIKYALIEQKYKPAKSQGANINYVHIIINLQSPKKYKPAKSQGQLSHWSVKTGLVGHPPEKNKDFRIFLGFESGSVSIKIFIN